MDIVKDADPEKYIEKLPEKDEKTENYAMAEEIFRGIKDYGFCHSSHFLTEAITLAIEEGFSSVIDYLEARFKEAGDSFRDDRTQRDIPVKLR